MKIPEQYPLQRIFERLNDTTYCRYTRGGDYPTVNEEGTIVLLHPLELLEMGKQYPSEHLMLAYFGDQPTRLLYAGLDAASMRRTVNDLRIPKRLPENLGEVVFYLFRDHLKKFDSGPLSLGQAVVAGKEHQFEFLLKRLLAVYKAADDTMQRQMQPYLEKLIVEFGMLDVH